MEILNRDIEKKHKGHWMRNLTLALGLALGVSNFSYSQENGLGSKNRIEQTNESGDKNINNYKIKVINRNNNIANNTSETLDEFVDRLQRQFDFEVGKNANAQQKINEIKSILSDKYSQNISNNDQFFIIQTALKTISNNDKYIGLSEYSNNFSGKFDLNFVDALGYVQYMNDLSCNGIISGKNGETTLNRIINDLNIGGDEQLVQNIVTDKQNNEYKDENSTSKQSIETIKITNNNKPNGINSDYTAKVKNRNDNITNNTSETLDEFAIRIKKQFEYELKDGNSLISKKIGNIETILIDKYNLNSYSNPIITIQSALIELSKTEKYKGLQEYTSKFSGNFDINFINAYGLVQYLDDWICNWSLHGKNGAFILQSIYDDLSNIGNDNGNNNNNDNGLNRDNTVQPDNTIQPNNTVQPNMDVDEDVDDPTENNVPNIKPDYREMEGISLLSKNLSSNKLNGITYEDVWNTVDGFKHEGLRNAVIHCLLLNDVIGAQRLLGMDINCNRNRYPNYVASTKLGHRELDLMRNFGESRRYMDTQEILNFMERVENAYEIENYEVKNIYLKFLSGEFDNSGLPYCIISKYDYKIYLFTADHKLVACQPVLTGAHIGNKKNNPMGGSHTTPGGMYVMGGVFDKSSEGKNLISVYGTDYLLLLPKEGQYHYSEEYSMGIHGYVKGREWRFSSQNTIDHRVSNGCINIDRATFGEIINHLKKGSKVYICKDDDS